MTAVTLSSGHGQALLAFLYDLARSRDSVFEITVEDPAPGFEKVNANLKLAFVHKKNGRQVRRVPVHCPVCAGCRWVEVSV